LRLRRLHPNALLPMPPDHPDASVVAAHGESAVAAAAHRAA
jgi:hypothetical protein